MSVVVIDAEELEQRISAAVDAGVRRALAEIGRPANEAPEWVDSETVAKMLGVHARTIGNLTRRGLPHRRVGKLYRFRAAEVLAWFEKAGA